MLPLQWKGGSKTRAESRWWVEEEGGSLWYCKSKNNESGRKSPPHASENILNWGWRDWFMLLLWFIISVGQYWERWGENGILMSLTCLITSFVMTSQSFNPPIKHKPCTQIYMSLTHWQTWNPSLNHHKRCRVHSAVHGQSCNVFHGWYSLCRAWIPAHTHPPPLPLLWL